VQLLRSILSGIGMGRSMPAIDYRMNTQESKLNDWPVSYLMIPILATNILQCGAHFALVKKPVKKIALDKLAGNLLKSSNDFRSKILPASEQRQRPAAVATGVATTSLALISAVFAEVR
jgi:hypothetical protein